MDEERRRILQMLAERKISVDEAVQLLEALSQGEQAGEEVNPWEREGSERATRPLVEDPFAPHEPPSPPPFEAGPEDAQAKRWERAKPDWHGRDLREMDLRGWNLMGADLHGANLIRQLLGSGFRARTDLRRDPQAQGRNRRGRLGGGGKHGRRRRQWRGHRNGSGRNGSRLGFGAARQVAAGGRQQDKER